MTVSLPAAARRRTTLSAVALGAGALLLTACGGVQGGTAASGESAADYPTKAVELTVPSSPGGSTDLIGRALARSAEGPLGKPLVVVNKPGANGAVGGKEVLGAPADGYKTVVLFKSLLSIGPLAVDDPDAITLEDMTVVQPLTVEDYVLVVPENSPHQTLDDLLEQDKVTYGTTGVGTGSHLAQALLFSEAGVDATDVPFEGGAPTMTAVLGKQVDAAVGQVAEAGAQIKAGTLRPLAVFSQERTDFLPDVPTAIEEGHEIQVDQRRFLAAPEGLTEPALGKLRAATTTAVKSPEFATFLKENYISPWDVAPDAVVPHLQESSATYADLIAEFGIDFKES